jgi:hypothetical protein
MQAASSHVALLAQGGVIARLCETQAQYCR